MMGFIAFFMLVFMGGFIVLLVQSLQIKRTLPVPTEFTTQLAGVSAAERVEQRAYHKPPVKNSHWYRHTFERPRRKVKK